MKSCLSFLITCDKPVREGNPKMLGCGAFTVYKCVTFTAHHRGELHNLHQAPDVRHAI